MVSLLRGRLNPKLKLTILGVFDCFFSCSILKIGYFLAVDFLVDNSS
jgi:hypothetical protein